MDRLDNIYLINTKSFYQLKAIINNIKTNNNINNDDISYFDWNDKNAFRTGLDQFLTDDFFVKNKLIIIKNCLLTKEPNFNLIDFKHQNNFLLLHTETTIAKKWLQNQIDKRVVYLELTIDNERDNLLLLERFLTSLTIKINHKISKKILLEIGNNFDVISNEIKRLKLISEEITSLTELDKVINKTVKSSFYQFIDDIFTKNFNELKLKVQTSSIEIIVIINWLINEIIKILQIQLINKTTKINDLAKELKLHPYYFTKLVNYSKKISNDQLLLILKNLMTIELKYKKQATNWNEQLFISYLFLLINNIEIK